MQLEVLKDGAQFPGIGNAWESLCRELAGEVCAFSSFAWYETWWRHYGAGKQLHLVTLREGERLVGIAPLMLRRVKVHGVPATAACFIGNSQSLNNDFIVLPSARELFLGELVGHLFGPGSPCDLLILKHLPESSENHRLLVALLDGTGRSWRRDRTSIDSPYLVPRGSFDEYLASRSTRTRKGLRNIANGIRQAGEVAVRRVTTAAEFLEVEEEVFHVARSSWAETGGDSLASPGNRAFFRDLALACAARGWLCLWTLCLDGRMVAVEFHLRAYGREHAMRGHYLPEFAALSPGTYLELQILKNAFEEDERVEVYDFCGSFDGYKRKWTDSSVPHVDVEVFGATPRGRLIAMNETRLVPFLRQALPQGFWNNGLFRRLGIGTNRLEMK